VRSSHLIFVFREQIFIFFSPVYTTQKCPPHHARKTMAARDLDCQREDRSSKFSHCSTRTVRSSHLTFVFLYQLPIFFQRRTVYTNALHVAQEKQRRRVSVCAKIDLRTYPNFRQSTNSSTQAVRSSHVIFVLRCLLLIFFHRPTLHTSILQTTQERQRRRVTLTISAKVQVRSSVILAQLTVRSSHLTFVFLYQLPIFFYRRTLYANALRSAQERQWRRVTFSVSAKVKI